LTVALEKGGWSRIGFEVNPGKSCMKFLSMAFRRVDSDGENRDAWANATSSGIFVGALI
jgi:hypothetical protein